MKDADVVLENEEATQEEVDRAEDALKDAVDNLKKVPEEDGKPEPNPDPKPDNGDDGKDNQNQTQNTKPEEDKRKILSRQETHSLSRCALEQWRQPEQLSLEEKEKRLIKK